MFKFRDISYSFLIIVILFKISRGIYINKSLVFSLRLFSVIAIIMVVSFIIFFAVFSIPKLEYHKESIASQGLIYFENLPYKDQAACLFGEWEFYSDTYITNVSELSLLQSPQFIEIPISNLLFAEQKATYRIFVSANIVDSDLFLYIPNLKDTLNVFVNGIKQKTLDNSDNSTFQGSYPTMVQIDSFNPALEFQEIVISANLEKTNSALYHRVPMITTMNFAVNHAYLKTINDTIIFGMFILITLSGFSFMILRPQHTIITLITLFDTAILLRILFDSSSVIFLLETIIPILHISDSFLLSGKIFSLMLGGAIGSILARNIFDPENKIPTYLTMPIPVVYLVFAAIFPFNIPLYYNVGKLLFIIFYVYTACIIFLQCVICLRRDKSFYSFFQITKTVYIGVVVFLDLISLDISGSFLIFQYLYVFFFCVHIISKLYDNNISYNEVYMLNKNLEKTVLERTYELSVKNKTLAELSIRDPLTSIYNRLYFDEIIEKTISNFNPDNDIVHLCMLDLDNFKLINDTYGHDIGDEQLTCITKTVEKIVLPDTVFARVGGEEFMILYTKTDSDAVLKNVETIRSALEEQSKENRCRTTGSFGVVKYTSSYSKKEFLKIADKQLYVAKENGKNNVVF